MGAFVCNKLSGGDTLVQLEATEKTSSVTKYLLTSIECKFRVIHKLTENISVNYFAGVAEEFFKKYRLSQITQPPLLMGLFVFTELFTKRI